jgi:hypothetical protein
MREHDFERVCKSGTKAWQNLKRDNKTWHNWLAVGEALLAGRDWAMSQANRNHPSGRGYSMAFGEWLKRFKLHDMDKGDRARLFKVMDDLPAIEEWRGSLHPAQRAQLNHPNSVLRKWQAETRDKDPNTKKRSKLTESVRDLDEQVALLKSQLADREAHIAELEAARLAPPISATLAEITEQWVTCFRAAADPDAIAQAAQRVADALGKLATAPKAISKAAVAAKRARRTKPQQTAEGKPGDD